MTTRTGDRLTNMMADTDEEIFDSALDADPASGGDDKSLEEMDDSLEGNEGRKAGDDDDDSDEGDDDSDGGEGDEDDKGDGKDGDKGKSEGDKDGDDKGRTNDDDDEPRRGDPKLALREERDRRRTAERERDTANEGFNRLLSRVEVLERERSAPARTAEKTVTDEEPDVFADPQGFKNSIVDAVTKQARLDRVETTFAEAHEEHGKVFETAYAALTALDRTNPADRALVQRISAAPNPGKALLKWHREQEARREIGDISTFREREREKLLKDPETRKQLLRELRREAEGLDDDDEPAPKARNGKRIPPSLNSGTRGGSRRGRDHDPGLYDDSEESVFDHATR